MKMIQLVDMFTNISPDSTLHMDHPDDALAQALDVFGLTLPVTQEQLTAKRKELLQTWYPARYANLTNNPKKYMQMYKQAEEMTKKIESAYSVLSSYLKSSHG